MDDVLALIGHLTIQPFYQVEDDDDRDDIVWLEGRPMHPGPVEIYHQTITTAGKNWITDTLQEVDAAADALKWHKSGVGTTAAVVGNTNLATGIYSRTAGTQTEGSGANVYRSVATINYTGTRSITEWGIFTTSTGGSMVSRKTFTAKSVTSGDAIQFTWDLTVG
jgi:hypothetical protein